MRRHLALTVLLASSSLLFGPMACTDSKWCETCGHNTPILGLRYQTNLLYTVGTPIQENLPNPAGGTPTRYEVENGTLPPGLTLNPSTGYITGTPTAPGVYTLIVLGTNPASSARQTLTITVVPSEPLALNYSTPMVFAAGSAISAQSPVLSYATPSVGTTYALSSGSLPAGLALDAATGTLAGTPTTPEVYAFTILATHGTRSAACALNYTIVPAGSLTLTYPTPLTFTAGTAIPTQTPSISPLTPGVPASLAVTSGSLPPGLVMNTDGTITGTPTFPGVYGFQVTLTNGTRTATFGPTYTVTPASPLSLSYATPMEFTEGAAIPTQTATLSHATPGVATTFALTGGALPAGLSLNPATGEITGTPTTPGVYPFTLAATNGTRVATATATYTVVSSAPMSLTYPSPREFPADSVITTQMPSAGPLTPGVNTTYVLSSGSLPGGLLLDADDGAISGTPTVPGVHLFSITATNGTRSATFGLSYTVIPASPLGLSYATPLEFTEGTAIPTQSATLSHVTPGVATTFALTGGALPAGLSLNPATGEITGTPTTPGVYAFTLTATNGTRSATFGLSYTVEESNPLTVSYPTPQTFQPNVVIATQSPTLTHGTPGVATAYGITSGALPSGLTLNGDGTITGTPLVAGSYTFTVTATNGTRTATSNVSYTVQNPAPTGLSYATPVTYTSGFAIAGNPPNPSGGTPTSYAITSGSLPAGLSLNASTGVISGTPSASGSFSATITGSNVAGSVQQILSITVLAPITAALSANPGAVTVGQASSLTPIFSGGSGVIDQGLGPVGSGGGISTGAYGAEGNITYTLTVTNAIGHSVTATATVAVVSAPPHSLTIPVPTTGTTYTYPTPGNPLSGLVVVVPGQGQAVCANTDLTIIRGMGQPQPGVIGGGAVAVSDPWTFSTTVGYPFRKPMTVTLPYDGSSLGASDVPVPFYWDPAYGKWVAVGLKSFNAGSQVVTFTTLLPGVYTIMAIPGLSGSLTNQSLGFLSTTDSWYQPNQGVFDDPGGSSFGMSAFASWYFGLRKSSNGNAGLYSLLREGDPNSTADDVSARALINRLANGTLETWSQLWSQSGYSLTGIQTGLTLITGLRVTGQPQIFLMGEARPALDNAVTTLVTGYTQATGKFNILDPNYPGMPLTITWNPGTGAFTSYDRAAGYVPTFTQYAFEGQTSIHRLADYERVFNGATGGWSNPPFATMTVSDVSGTGPVSSGALATVASASNVTIDGTISNGSDTATHIYWSQNGGARTPVALTGNAFSFTIPALLDPYGTRIALETTANPCDPTFSFTGYTEFNVKETGRTAWFPNICFEGGTTAPWSLDQGNNAGIPYPASPTFSSATGAMNGYAVTWSAGSIDSTLVTVANDVNVSSISQVFDGTTAFRVNNPATGAHISRIYQNITIPTDVATPKLTFYWAAVMQNAGHAATDQPYVDILIQDVTNNYETVYFKHFYANDPSYPGWIAGAGSGATQWFGINWQKVGLSNLTGRKGHVLRITVTSADCTLGGHGGYAYLDGVNCN